MDGAPFSISARGRSIVPAALPGPGLAVFDGDHEGGPILRLVATNGQHGTSASNGQHSASASNGQHGGSVPPGPDAGRLPPRASTVAGQLPQPTDPEVARLSAEIDALHERLAEATRRREEASARARAAIRTEIAAARVRRAEMERRYEVVIASLREAARAEIERIRGQVPDRAGPGAGAADPPPANDGA